MGKLMNKNWVTQLIVFLSKSNAVLRLRFGNDLNDQSQIIISFPKNFKFMVILHSLQRTARD